MSASAAAGRYCMKNPNSRLGVYFAAGGFQGHPEGTSAGGGCHQPGQGGFGHGGKTTGARRARAQQNACHHRQDIVFFQRIGSGTKTFVEVFEPQPLAAKVLQAVFAGDGKFGRAFQRQIDFKNAPAGSGDLGFTHVITCRWRISAPPSRCRGSWIIRLSIRLKEA